MVRLASFNISEFSRRAYPEDKLRFEAQYIWSRRVLVPGGVLLGWFFAILGITPNQTTYLSFVAAGLGFILVATDVSELVVTGLLLVNLWQVLDCADGALARATGRTSQYGAFIDTLGGYVVMIALPVMTGLGAALQPDDPLKEVLATIGWSESSINVALVPLAFGAMASAALALRCISGFLYLGQTAADHQNITTALEREAGNLRQGIRWFRQNWLELPGFMLPLLVLLALFHMLSFWIIVYGVLTFLDTSGVMLMSLIRLKREKGGLSASQ